MAYRRGLSPRHVTFFTARETFTSRREQARDEPDAKLTSMSDFFWEESKDLAEAALKTKFIRGIQDGNLKPEQYGIYTVQDAAYCHDVVEDYSTVIERTKDPDVRLFLQKRQEGFREYTQELLKQWHIQDADAIILGEASKEYSDLEKEIASEYEPLYFVVVSIPCSRLWYWLAKKIAPYAVPGNLYQFWIDENLEGDGGKKLESFVDGHAMSLDQEKALIVYRKAMIGEVNFFRSACGEELIPTQ